MVPVKSSIAKVTLTRDKRTYITCLCRYAAKEGSNKDEQTKPQSRGSGMIRLNNLLRQGTSGSTMTHFKTVFIQLLDRFDPNGTFMSSTCPAIWHSGRKPLHRKGIRRGGVLPDA